MKIVNVSCQQCGAPLEVGEGVRFLTCKHCGARLALVEEPTNTHTRVLSELRGDMGVLKARVEAMEIRAAIEQLDEAWNRMLKEVHGAKTGEPFEPPTIIRAKVFLVLGLVLCGLSILWTLKERSSHREGAFNVMAGIVVAGVLVQASRRHIARVREYEQSETRYLIRRHELEAMLQEAGAASA